jgi:hypothetical protein
VAKEFQTGGDIDSVFDEVVARIGLNRSEEEEAVRLVKEMIASGTIVLRQKIEPAVEPEDESVLTPAQEARYGHNECHYLTTAILKLRPSGQPWGLYNKGYNLTHSVVELSPGRFVDAFGVFGKEGLEERAHNFLFIEDPVWRPMSEEEVWKSTALDRSRRVRKAMTAAKRLLSGVR